MSNFECEVHAAESVAYLNRALVRLQDIWEEIGIPEEQRLQRTNDVHKHIKGLLDLMIAEEEELKKRLLKSIQSCLKELNHLCSELQMPPFEEEDGCTMLQMEKNSRTRLEVMKEHKKQRMDELKGLIGKDRELCDIMCTTPFCIDPDSIPSLTQLETYRTYLDDLTKEKERRHNEFVSLKKEIVVCMDDLEQSPETSFETDVMCEDEEAFCLSNDNIAALKLLLSQLQDRKAENELRCSAFRTKIQELWERLEIPQEEREALSEHMVKSKKRNIEALRAEVQRLEVLKLQSMKRVIEAVRAEIALFWERCFYSPEQQEAFVHYHDDDFTEDLLNLHEAEVRTLKKCYEDHRELFEGVRKWQENWTLYLELDKKANDPSRFNNRGGNLLKEEKQRADLQKSLPKLEKSLKAQIDVWEQEHGKEFLVNGQKFLEYVQQQWEHHHAEKEKEKLERQMKKTKQIQEDMLYGTSMRTPSKRRVAGTPTPGKVRKLNGTSTISTPNSFLSSGLGGTMCQSSIQKPPLSASKGLGLRTPGHGKTPRALDRNKENISHLRNTPSGTLRSQDTQDHTFTFNSVAGSYSEFARDLSKASKSNVKSGVLNSTVSHQ
ncbi:protein regulator of cytokinesis 1-like isoform X1 [Epinephelus fuscoguttatus]|uniref:protein regulator of cytokinesis 1-like isoform X1 n=1 Tax=Epinephelus lanceolatus TaxID=310571 RepID=UPI001446A419|nr:protein regulator of cytokinesis 1-like isoform X1 [Epinephelus lanceolatus]XP_049429163.1 protein regulator of cytokinesis 1-like isoform X1 [Epinephelus fuscoguttatus]